MLLKKNVGAISRSSHLKDEFLWTLPDYFSYRKSDTDSETRRCVLSSPSFYFLNAKWRLLLMRNRLSFNNRGFVGLFLWRISFSNCLPNFLYGRFGNWNSLDPDFICVSFENCNEEFLKVFCELQTMKKKHVKKSAVIEKIHKFDLSEDEETMSDEEDTSDEENASVKENTSDEEYTSGEEDTNDEEDNDSKKLLSKDKGIKILLENLKQALLDGQRSDVVLKVDSREFNVHSMILVARSPVFATMFQHDMKEKKDNVVDIPDCTAESFEVLLSYLYTGSAEALSSSNVYDVYYAADKYQLVDLKEKCIHCMTNTISVETFCDIIALSLRHGEAKLQKEATNFFCKNIRKIIKTVQWQVYLEKNSTQANELLIKALKA